MGESESFVAPFWRPSWKGNAWENSCERISISSCEQNFEAVDQEYANPLSFKAKKKKILKRGDLF
jgi:hypothetical protein